jgi:hypothetical protein
VSRRLHEPGEELHSTGLLCRNNLHAPFRLHSDNNFKHNIHKFQHCYNFIGSRDNDDEFCSYHYDNNNHNNNNASRLLGKQRELRQRLRIFERGPGS